MRIAQMIDTLEIGGAQKLLVTFARAVRKRDVDLTVISLREGGNPCYYDELRDLGIQVVTFTSSSLLELQRIRCLVHYLKHEGVEILHTHLTYANIIGVITGKLAGVPVIASLHSVGRDPLYSHPIRDRLETWTLRYGARQVIAVGHTVSQAHRDRLPGIPVIVVLNAVEVVQPTTSERSALRAKIMHDPSQPLLISVGRLSTPKGYADLIEAFAILREKYPAAELLVVGEGVLRDELEAQIEALELEDYVKLLGSRDDVSKLLVASDIYVSSSLWEGLPLAVLEAMAAGLPVVATSVGDVPHVVVDGTGIVVPPHKPTMIAEAVMSLLDHPKKMIRYGKAAQAHVATHYGAEIWADELLKLYSKVISSS